MKFVPIIHYIINATGYHFTKLFIFKIINIDLNRVTHGDVLTAIIFLISSELVQLKLSIRTSVGESTTTEAIK